jgi:hypothetical protein
VGAHEHHPRRTQERGRDERGERGGYQAYIGAAVVSLWIRDKYERLRRRRKALACMRGIAERYPRMFAHWKWVTAASLV